MEKKKEKETELFGANMKNNKTEITDTFSEILKTQVKWIKMQKQKGGWGWNGSNGYEAKLKDVYKIFR